MTEAETRVTVVLCVCVCVTLLLTVLTLALSRVCHRKTYICTPPVLVLAQTGRLKKKEGKGKQAALCLCGFVCCVQVLVAPAIHVSGTTAFTEYVVIPVKRFLEG